MPTSALKIKSLLHRSNACKGLTLLRYMPIVTCSFCKVEFKKKQSHIKTTKSNYCSKSCYVSSIQTQEEKKCELCDSLLSQTQIKQGNLYCSRSCSAKVNNKTHPKRTKTNKCKTCSKEISSNRRYCSSSCRPKKEEKLKTVNVKSKNQPLERKEIIKSFMRRLKIRCVEYLGGKCEICGYNKCMSALHFHHKDSSQKEFGISGRSIKFERLKPELDKCILVCANCHSEIHEGLVSSTYL